MASLLSCLAVQTVTKHAEVMASRLELPVHTYVLACNLCLIDFHTLLSGNPWGMELGCNSSDIKRAVPGPWSLGLAISRDANQQSLIIHRMYGRS